MGKSKMFGPQIVEKNGPLTIGFIPDSDCAPLVAARESGLFEKYDLKVELRRETTWAAIRDRVIHGDLHAAHAPVTLPFIANLGVESDRCACIAAMVLSLQGNAVTLSRKLWNDGVRDAAGLRDLIYRNWGRKTFTFGVVFPFSPPYFLLRQWLRAGDIVPHVEVRIVVLPPAQMFPTLKLGYIDGFCVGEPWTSLAIDSQAGVCVATSAELAPLHPEKVLMVRRDFADARGDEHERLVAALIEACAFCDQPQNHSLLAEMLCQPHYVNAPAECLKHGLAGPPHAAGSDAGLNIFYRNNANEPTDDRAAWVVSRLYELMDATIIKLPPVERTPVLKNVFRRDIYRRARDLVAKQKSMLAAEVDRYETRAGCA